MSGNRKNWTLKWCRVQACHLSAEAGWGGAEGTLDSGADPGFFLGRVALVSCSTSTPINHIVFFCRKPVVLENRRSSQTGGGGGGGPPAPPPPPPPTPCTLPLDPPLRLLRVSQEVYKLSLQMASAMKQFGFNSWKSLICKDFQDYVHIIPWNYVQLNLAYGYLVWRPSSKFIYQLF